MNSYTLHLDNDFLIDVEQAIEQAIANEDISGAEYGYNLDSPNFGEFSVAVDASEKVALDQAIIAAGIHRVDIVCGDTTEYWRDDIKEGAGQIVEFLLVISQEPTHLCSMAVSYFAKHLGWDTTKNLGSEGEDDEKFVMVKNTTYTHTVECAELSERGSCLCPDGQPQAVISEERESLHDAIGIGMRDGDQGGDYYGVGILGRESIPVYFRPEDDEDLNDEGYLNSNAPWFWNIAEDFGGGSFDSEGLIKRSGFTF